VQALDAITGQTSPGLPPTVFSPTAAPAPSPKGMPEIPAAAVSGSGPSGKGTDGGKSTKKGLIIGSVCISALLLIGTVLAGILLRRRVVDHRAVCSFAALS
jgi:hypothetical protein